MRREAVHTGVFYSADNYAFGMHRSRLIRAGRQESRVGSVRTVAEQLASSIKQRLEPPEGAAADEEVVLACLAGRGQWKIRFARPKVPDFATNAELFPDFDV